MANMPQEAIIIDESYITDEELLKISAANPNMRFELVKGELITMPPVGEISGELEGDYFLPVKLWCKKNKARCFSASTGFKLKNGDVRSADVAVRLPFHPEFGKKSKSFVKGAPDFLIEIRSKSDTLSKLKKKMQIWIKNECKLAFVIDPLKRKAYVYRKDGSVTKFTYAAKLSGEDVLSGFSVCPAEIEI